jgi:alkylation response protein AidB-like acyl-CoA dehydrogenase
MNFELTQNQISLQKRIADFCRKHSPQELESRLDQTDTFPEELYRAMAEEGFFSVPYPEAYSGGGGNILDVVLITEQLARYSYSAVNMYLVNIVFAGLILNTCASDEQKSRFIPSLLKGETKFSFALTEPEAGSDARGIKTYAENKGDFFLINGEKYWTTGASVADYILTVVITSRETEPSKSMTIFIVPTGAHGLSVEPIHKLAGNAYPSCHVKFCDVKVSRENILGGSDWLNSGMIQLFQTADIERVTVAASCIGGAETILKECTDFAKTREQFGKPIIKFQAIQHELADMATRIEAMRWMTYHAAWMRSQGKDCFKEICMAKLFCSESVNDIARKGMQIFGGKGYSMEINMQRYLRESYLSLYAGGTSEIQKNVISRFL